MFALASEVKGKRTVQIWALNEQHNKYVKLSESGAEEHKAHIVAISWAPFIGRPYHLIATASEDASVILWKTELGQSGEEDEFAKPYVSLQQKIETKQPV